MRIPMYAKGFRRVVLTTLLGDHDVNHFVNSVVIHDVFHELPGA